MSAAALAFAVDWEMPYSRPSPAPVTNPITPAVSRNIDVPQRRTDDLLAAFDGIPWNLESFSTGDPRLWSLYEVWLNVQDSAGELPVWDLDLIPRLAPWLPDMFEVRFPGTGPRISRFGSSLTRALGVDLIDRDLASSLLGPGSERIDADARRARSTARALWS